MDIKTAIEDGNTVALQAILDGQPDMANQLIVWGKNSEIRTHPLHYVSDMLFAGILKGTDGTDLIDILLAAGAVCNHQAPNGETALIGAASLSAEAVGLRLLDAGALPDLRGAFQETALHWASFVGLRRLCEGLIQKGADVNVRDARYESTPLGWAIHARYTTSPKNPGDHCEVVTALVLAGAIVDPSIFRDERVMADSTMLSALRSVQGADAAPK